MDELLAQELGVGPGPGTSYLDENGNAPPAVPQEAPPLNIGGYNEEDLAGIFGFGPSQSGPANDVSPAPAPLQPGEKQSASSKSSGKAFSPEVHAQLSAPKGPEGQLRARQAQIGQDSNETFKSVTGLFNNAQDLESQAIDEEAAAQNEYDSELATQKGVLAQHKRETATKVEEIQARHETSIAEARANHIAALNDFRTSKVDPGQFWNGLSGGNKVGMIATAFVDGFLGAKGIKTGATDTMMKAIDRNIHLQVEAIKHKGEVASGFKDLWEMARSESSSEIEAFTRMRGYGLEAAVLEVEQHMLQFKTPLNDAKATAAKAALEKERSKNLFEVYKYIDQSKNAQMQQEISWATAKMTNSQQAFANSIANAREKREARKQEREEKALKASRVLINPETGTAERVFRDDARPEDVTNVRDRTAKMDAANTDMARMRELVRKVPAAPDGTPGRLQGEDARELMALRKRWAHSALAAMGERATNEDVADFLSSIPQDTWLTNGGVEKIYAGTHKGMIDSVNGFVKQYTVDIGQVDPLSSGKNLVMRNSRKEADLVNSGEADRKDLNQKLNATAAKGVNAPDSAGPAQSPGDYAKKDAAQFREQYPEQSAKAVGDMKKAMGDAGGPVDRGAVSETITEYEAAKGMTKAQASLSEIAAMAKSGNPEARKKLEFYADSWLRHVPGSDSDWKGAYAAMLLGNIDGK